MSSLFSTCVASSLPIYDTFYRYSVKKKYYKICPKYNIFLSESLTFLYGSRRLQSSSLEFVSGQIQTRAEPLKSSNQQYDLLGAFPGGCVAGLLDAAERHRLLDVAQRPGPRLGDLTHALAQCHDKIQLRQNLVVFALHQRLLRQFRRDKRQRTIVNSRRRYVREQVLEATGFYK